MGTLEATGEVMQTLDSEFERVATLLEGVPHMGRHQGRLLYQHLRATRRVMRSRSARLMA
jgi:hypothetical protein